MDAWARVSYLSGCGRAISSAATRDAISLLLLLLPIKGALDCATRALALAEPRPCDRRHQTAGQNAARHENRTARWPQLGRSPFICDAAGKPSRTITNLRRSQRKSGGKQSDRSNGAINHRAASISSLLFLLQNGRRRAFQMRAAHASAHLYSSSSSRESLANLSSICVTRLVRERFRPPKSALNLAARARALIEQMECDPARWNCSLEKMRAADETAARRRRRRRETVSGIIATEAPNGRPREGETEASHRLGHKQAAFMIQFGHLATAPQKPAASRRAA